MNGIVIPGKLLVEIAREHPELVRYYFPCRIPYVAWFEEPKETHILPEWMNHPLLYNELRDGAVVSVNCS